MKKSNQAITSDIKDAEKDLAKMQPERTFIDMPEVKDIPGQENIIPPRLGEMEDITVSSADEEGTGLLDNLNEENEEAFEIDDRSDVSAAERKLLQKSAAHPYTAATADFNRMILDEKDAEGEFLNEKGLRQDRNGADLDVPGSELDDQDELTGEEDEENNIYSQTD